MRTFDIINPATSAVLDHAPDASVEEAKQAVEKSVAAFAMWKAKTPFERSTILRKWYELILKDEDTLAKMMTQEMGKPITESRGEVKYAAAFVEWYAEEAKRAYGEIVPSHANNKRLFAIRQPVGPVYAVTPWNFPAAMVTRKVAPALAAGCSVVLKPAEQSPLTESRWVPHLCRAHGVCPLCAVRSSFGTVSAVHFPAYWGHRVGRGVFARGAS